MMTSAARLALSAAMLVGVSVAAGVAAGSRLMMHARRFVMSNSTAPGDELIGQVVMSRCDRRWRGLVVGTTSGHGLLQVEWARPGRFIGLAHRNDLEVINDPTVKDHHVCHRR